MRFIGRKRRKGFTLVELLIVVAILGILAAVVIPSVLGLMGRGSAQAYETDQKVIQLAAATFYADIHGGLSVDATIPPDYALTEWQHNDATEVQSDGHYFPTAIAASRDHTLTLGNLTDPDEPNSFMIMDPNPANPAANGEALDAAIEAHAIWMGLLVNADAPGTFPGEKGRGIVAPVTPETALYLQEIPQSASDDYNGAVGGGGYAWVVGKNGVVYGAYKLTAIDPGGGFPVGDYWYSGFSGVYP